ncbi:MAG: hypothetical protein KBA97_04825 [Methanothrix sp.]|nr:hypothetical protein [Methanothrix sp.]
MSEYIEKGLGPNELLAELHSLIKSYNSAKGTFMLVYASAVEKPIPDCAMCMDDYYTIRDLLRKNDLKKLDFYIETPGGRGEAAEEIARFIRERFDDIDFVISGEAKSAGTVLALSGDNIWMTESGSLGPIDAQVKIGRTQTSAHDYIEWVDEKREEANKIGKLNPFDAVVTAQISPGELKHVFYAQKFSEDLVKEWLPKYKFKNWVTTETRGVTVTPEMRQDAADSVVRELLNHSRWRSHGRSLKIADLNGIGLKIEKLDENPILAEIVYKIQTLIRLLFLNTNIYKIFATDSEKIIRQAVPAGGAQKLPPLPGNAKSIQIDVKCQKCGEMHKFYAKFEADPLIDKQLQEKGFQPFPKTNKLICKCGFELDLSGLRNDIEAKTRKKFII